MYSLLRYFLLVPTVLMAAPMGFQEVYQSALQKNELVQMKRNETAQSDARVSQAFGEVLPKIAANGSYTRQHNPSDTGLAIARPDQWMARITLTQPIFRGLSDIYAYQAVKAKSRAQSLLETQAQLDLYRSSAAAFYGLLSAQQDLEEVKLLFDLTEKRASEIRSRVKIGRSRKGDLLSVESQAAALGAEVQASLLKLDQAKETFLLVTGIGGETELKESNEKLIPRELSFEKLGELIEKRPDVLASKEEFTASDDSVTAVRGGHYPTIDFTGNYYLHRTGFLQDVKWDIGFVASFPIFNGGIIQSQISEKVEERKSRELSLSYARRNAEKDIRASYKTYRSLLEQHQTLEKAFKLAEANYNEQNKDYRYGLVTNLDVLQAMNALNETKRSKVRIYYEAKSAYCALEAALGEGPKKEPK